MSLLKDRNKLTLLADKSPYGLKTVLEYKHHDLADDEEDEKKIYRAKGRAARASKRFAPLVWDYSADLECLSQEIRSSPSTKFLIPLLGSINSFTLVDLLGFAFPVENLDIGELPCPNVLSSSNPANQQSK